MSDDGEKWRRAKDYIEAQIAAHQKAINVGGLSFEGFHTHMLKREAYRRILEEAENVPTKP